MTNPNDAIGTNAGFGGRTSPNAFNDNLAAYSRGIVAGWTCSPKTGMTVQLGGSGSVRDVAIAEDNAGNRTTINNRLGTPVEITLSGAPATGNRIDTIVAYVENPAQGSSTDVDFAPASGIIAVEGTASGTPSAPNEAAIRTAITADGADGSTAYYVELAQITVGQGVTVIGSGSITAGASSQTALVSTIVQNELNAFKNSLTITSFDSTDSIGTISNITIDSKSITLAQSADGSTFKFYGSIFLGNSTGSARYVTPVAVPGLSGVYGRATGLFLNSAPATAYQIMPAGLRTNNDNSKVIQTYTQTIAIGTDGQIYIWVTSNSTGISISANTAARFYWYPCVYFNTNFGDAGES